MNFLQPSKITAIVLGAVLCLYAICRLIFTFIDAYYYSSDVTSWWVTEFLINYQGGYVRRGLIGELLYQFSSYFHADPRFIIWPLCIISLITISAILIYKFKKANWCIWVLPLCTCLFGADFLRKDHLCFVLIAVWLYTFSKKIDSVYKFIIISAITVILFNIHEASFFLFAPYCCLALLSDKREGCKKTYNYLTVLVTIATMGVVVIHKGNEVVARAIQDSWTFYFPDEFKNDLVTTIQSLKWDTKRTLLWHLHQNFLETNYGFQGLYTKPLAWLTTLFIIPNIIFKNSSLLFRKTADEPRNFLCVFLFQFLSLSPLFFFLSCDPIRIISYWTISSFLIYLFIPEIILFVIPCCFKRVANSLQKVIFSKYSLGFSLFAMFFVCMSHSAPDILEAFSHSIVATLWKACVCIYSTIVY